MKSKVYAIHRDGSKILYATLPDDESALEFCQERRNKLMRKDGNTIKRFEIYSGKYQTTGAACLLEFPTLPGEYLQEFRNQASYYSCMLKHAEALEKIQLKSMED